MRSSNHLSVKQLRKNFRLLTSDMIQTKDEFDINWTQFQSILHNSKRCLFLSIETN